MTDHRPQLPCRVTDGQSKVSQPPCVTDGQTTAHQPPYCATDGQTTVVILWQMDRPQKIIRHIVWQTDRTEKADRHVCLTDRQTRQTSRSIVWQTDGLGNAWVPVLSCVLFSIVPLLIFFCFLALISWFSLSCLTLLRHLALVSRDGSMFCFCFQKYCLRISGYFSFVSRGGPFHFTARFLLFPSQDIYCFDLD